MKTKVLIIIAILILIGGSGAAFFLLTQNKEMPNLPFLSMLNNGQKPTNVTVDQIDDQSANIGWQTEKSVAGAIIYGVEENNLALIQEEKEPTVNHQLQITGLLAESKYYFNIKVDKTIYDDNGRPYSFTTMAKPTPTPTPSPVPLPTASPVTVTEETIGQAIGTNNPLYDLNKDGIVNFQDINYFRQNPTAPNTGI